MAIACGSSRLQEVSNEKVITCKNCQFVSDSCGCSFRLWKIVRECIPVTAVERQIGHGTQGLGQVQQWAIGRGFAGQRALQGLSRTKQATEIKRHRKLLRRFLHEHDYVAAREARSGD